MQITRWMMVAGLTFLAFARPACADDSPLAGDRLWLRGDGASGSNRTLLRLVDPSVNVGGLDPAQSGGSVRLVSPSTGQTLTFPLPAAGWTKATNGRERRFSAVVNGVRVRASIVGGRAVRVSAPGINVPPLAGPLGVVAALVDIGPRRFCGFFGGKVATDDASQFLARRAPRPSGSCADVQCIGAADGLACDDGDPGTSGEICVAGTCAVDLCFGVTCTASDTCHDAGTCDTTTGQCSNPVKSDGALCDDGNAATSGEICVGGTCKVDRCYGIQCNPSDQCHAAGSCDPDTGLCSNPVSADGTACDDGNAATSGEVCVAGVCGPNLCTNKTCVALDQCHDAGSCSFTTGLCSNPAKPDGAECSDGNGSTTQDQCKAGVCAQATCPCRGVSVLETIWSASWPGKYCGTVSVFDFLEASDETEAACGQLVVQTEADGLPYCRVQDGEIEVDTDGDISCDSTDGDEKVLGPLTPKEAALCRGDLRSFATANMSLFPCPF